MKAYTDLEQSKVLAEILPHDTADQIYERFVITKVKDAPKEILYKHNGDVPFQICGGIGIPCWSLAALFDVIKNKCGYVELVYLKHAFDSRINPLDDVYRLSTNVYDVYKKEEVDACYEMIVKLNELKLL